MRILNEEKYIQDVVENGFGDNNVGYKIRLLAIYYYLKGLRGKALENQLIDFCEKNIHNFNYVLSYKMIDKAVKNASKNKLFVVDKIRITDLEIEKIKVIKDKKLEKLMFVLLVLAKINKLSYMHYIRNKINNKSTKKLIFKDYYVNESSNEIFKLAQISTNNSKRRSVILQRLVELGYIKITLNGKIIVNIVNNHSRKNYCLINNFTNFILIYTSREHGEKVIYCEECGVIEKKRSSTSKYCKECAKEIEREHVRKRVEKHRKNKM